MKEKLIEILSTAPAGLVGIGPSDTELAEHILNNFRCSECLHWDNFSPETETGSCDEVDRLTRPDFFCARWEAK